MLSLFPSVLGDAPVSGRGKAGGGEGGRGSRAGTPAACGAPGTAGDGRGRAAFALPGRRSPEEWVPHLPAPATSGGKGNRFQVVPGDF